ncbi:hypothetical protein ACT3UD_13685 [Glutamicibacter sp. 287]|uniref:hypothetical protein n=1 Tax=unclassified Glutamicibacter TaxID=2627139 RepID=UPI000BB7C824|nr:hypothetical protein [Glutamicibacter sp. BW80]PCC29807.1 hypothetical protein CIK76_05285 [Glutamicibacter sp. BW80]
MSNNESSVSRPPSVLAVSALTMLEAVAVLVYAVNYLMHLADAGDLNMGGRIFMLVLCFAAGAWQISVSFNFFKGKAFTRAPIIVWQLFQLILSFSFLQGPFSGIAIAAIVIAGIIVVMLFAPKTTVFLGDRPQS